MHPCSRCHRHVLVTASDCPFCGAPQRDTGTSLGGFAGVLLGLALAGCGDDTSPDPTGASSTMTTMSTEPTAGESTTGGSNATTEVEGGEAADYGGSGPIEESGLETTPADSGSSDESSGETSGSTGTDTGSSTTDTGSAESADYGGATPRD